MVENRKATEPLATATLAYGLLMAGLLMVVVISTIWGSGSIGGFGHGTVCATNPQVMVSGDGHAPFAARPGSYLSLDAPLQACALHPGATQRILYTLTGLPAMLLWVGLLLLLWRLIKIATRRGPLAFEVAAAMRFLGWFILAGYLVAGVIQMAANDALLNTMVAHQDNTGAGVHALISGLPVPLLVGTGLLTFARITRIGAALDEDLKGTV
jgi:hypothetical protein